MKLRADDGPVNIASNGFPIKPIRHFHNNQGPISDQPIVKNFATARDYFLKSFGEDADEQKVQQLLKVIETIFLRTKTRLDAPGIKVLIVKRSPDPDEGHKK
jgi:hypothetical protein